MGQAVCAWWGWNQQQWRIGHDTGTATSPPRRALGTEALGIDLSKPLDEAPSPGSGAPLPSIRCWCSATRTSARAELAAFGRRFGAPRMHALIKYRHADYPEVSWLTNVEEDGQGRLVRRQARHRLAHRFHLRGRICRCWPSCTRRRCPSEKGGTMFADMRAAYDALAGGQEAAARPA